MNWLTEMKEAGNACIVQALDKFLQSRNELGLSEIAA